MRYQHNTRLSYSLQTLPHRTPSHLRLYRPPLHLLLTIPLPLLFQKLPLLLRTQPSQLRIPLLALILVQRELPLLGLFLIVEFPYLGDLLLTRGFDAAQGFGAEMCGGGEVVGEA